MTGPRESAGEESVTERLQLTASESLTIRERSAEALVVEAEYGPGGSPPPKHFHPSQDEHFRVLAGTLRARVGGELRELSAGDELDVPRGTVHQMWNPGEAPARLEWRTSPAGRTESWFRAVDALHRGDPGATPGPLAFAPLLREYDDVIRLAGPQPLVRPALTALAVLGRARGQRPSAG